MFTAIALDFTARGTMRAPAEKVLARMSLCGLYFAIWDRYILCRVL